MRLDRFGGFLLVTGAIVGVFAVVGLAVGFEPSQLPAKLLDLAAYKLTFGAAAALLAVGAIIRRHAKREVVQRSVTPERPSSAMGTSPAALPLPVADHDVVADQSKRSDIKVPRDR